MQIIYIKFWKYFKQDFKSYKNILMEYAEKNAKIENKSTVVSRYKPTRYRHSLVEAHVFIVPKNIWL